MRRAIGCYLGVLAALSAALGACAGAPFREGDGDANGGAGGAGGGSAGGAGASFVLECVWNRPTCPTCESLCPSVGGDGCLVRCQSVLTCTRENKGCATREDPMCVRRLSADRMNVCTMVWDSAGGGNDVPSQAASMVFNCACVEP